MLMPPGNELVELRQDLAVQGHHHTFLACRYRHPVIPSGSSLPPKV